MAFGLYKPGQGYWVRVLTATGAGILVLALAGWLWQRLEVASARVIPISAWQVTLSPAEGEVSAGQSVSLHGESAVQGQIGPEIAVAVVRSVERTQTGAIRVEIAPPTFTSAGVDISQARTVRPLEGGGATLRGQISGTAQAMRAFDALYLQAGGVAVVLLAGALLIYIMVGTKPSSVEFLIATDGEMKKVNWSTRKNIIDSTLVVLLWSLLLAAGLFGVDFLFGQFFRAIGVLQG